MNIFLQRIHAMLGIHHGLHNKMKRILKRTERPFPLKHSRFQKFMQGFQKFMQGFQKF